MASNGSRAENPPIQVFRMARGQRFGFDQSKRSPPIGQPFGTKEQGRIHLFTVKPLGQIEQVGHVEYLDASFQQSPDNLPGDLRAFSLVG